MDTLEGLDPMDRPFTTHVPAPEVSVYDKESLAKKDAEDDEAADLALPEGVFGRDRFAELASICWCIELPLPLGSMMS